MVRRPCLGRQLCLGEQVGRTAHPRTAFWHAFLRKQGHHLTCLLPLGWGSCWQTLAHRDQARVPCLSCTGGRFPTKDIVQKHFTTARMHFLPYCFSGYCVKDQFCCREEFSFGLVDFTRRRQVKGEWEQSVVYSDPDKPAESPGSGDHKAPCFPPSFILT